MGQNNEISWFNWDSLGSQPDFHRFVKGLIGLIQNLSIFKHDYPLIVTPQIIGEPAITWHGVKLGRPDWSHNSHSLAFTLSYHQYGEQLHVMLNAFYTPLTFELPPLPPGRHWRRVIDTALPAPEDFSQLESAIAIKTSSYRVTERSSVVLMVTSG